MKFQVVPLQKNKKSIIKSLPLILKPVALRGLDTFSSFFHYHHENMPYNIDTLKRHFYTVKLGFIGVYIIFLICAQKHRL